MAKIRTRFEPKASAIAARIPVSTRIHRPASGSMITTPYIRRIAEN
jgi:hypothetical protein